MGGSSVLHIWLTVCISSRSKWVLYYNEKTCVSLCISASWQNMLNILKHAYPWLSFGQEIKHFFIISLLEPGNSHDLTWLLLDFWTLGFSHDWLILTTPSCEAKQQRLCIQLFCQLNSILLLHSWIKIWVKPKPECPLIIRICWVSYMLYDNMTIVIW